MENYTNTQNHSTGDEVLSLLSNIPGTLGSFVRAFPGSQFEDESWLDSWFLTHINKYFNNTITLDDKILLHKVLPTITQGSQPAEPIRIKSILPHYFRGFRDVQEPINLDGNLIAIEGRNSSGKTSLAESLEWLFSGKLSRRENKELGSPRELENCISNEFRPDNDITWVKATFILTNESKNEVFTLCRFLKSDYGSTSESKCLSILTKNDVELSAKDEWKELDRLFASEPPLLMQHTLRDFVQSNPRDRRKYFERLLRLDEITNLISKAVIGTPHLKEFLSPSGSKALKSLTVLEEFVEKIPSKKACSQLYQNKESDVISKVKAALCLIANQEFPNFISVSTEFDNIRVLLEKEQEKAKQRSLPLIEKIHPKKIILEGQSQSDHTQEIVDISGKIRQAWKTYESAHKAVQSIGKERIVISQILDILIEKDLIQIDVPSQICPLCDYKLLETLTAERISEIRGWTPIQQAELSAKKSLLEAFDLLTKLIQGILREYDEFIPKPPSSAEWEMALKEISGELKQTVQNLRKTRRRKCTSRDCNIECTGIDY